MTICKSAPKRGLVLGAHDDAGADYSVSLIDARAGLVRAIGKVP